MAIITAFSKKSNIYYIFLLFLLTLFILLKILFIIILTFFLTFFCYKSAIFYKIVKTFCNILTCLKYLYFLTVLTFLINCFLCLLKIVEIIIIRLSGEKMKQQVLKALANPARIFYVPYNLAVINFAVQFIVFIIFFTIDLVINSVDVNITPLYFLISVIIVHSILAVYSKRDPQLGQIVMAKIYLFKQKIPGRLVA